MGVSGRSADFFVQMLLRVISSCNSPELCIISTMHCLSIVYSNPNPSYCLLLHKEGTLLSNCAMKLVGVSGSTPPPLLGKPHTYSNICRPSLIRSKPE